MLPEYEPVPEPPARDRNMLDVAIPVSVALVLVLISFAFRAPCVAKLGNLEYAERHLCYTDIYALYGVEGLNKGSVPYFDVRPDGKYVEYPVVIGGWMFVTSRVTTVLVGEPDRGTVRGYNTYFWVNQLLFGALILIAAAALGALVGWRRALLFAAAPTLILHGGVSWDILAVTPFVVALYAFSRRRIATSGILLGVGAAAKLYPIFAVPFLAIQLARERRLKQAVTLGITSVATVVAVNLPVAIGARQGWLEFFRLNKERGADWDSIWYHVAQTWHVSFNTPKLNAVTALLFVLGVLALAAWQWFRLPHDGDAAFDGVSRTTATAMFLVVLWFLVVNKVWSPQYGIWLLPFWTFAVPFEGAALLVTWAVFQCLEIYVFATRFWMFASKVTYSAFRTAIFARLAALIVLVSWLLARKPRVTSVARVEPVTE